MAFKMGFHASAEPEPKETVGEIKNPARPPRRSVVRVFFPARNFACSYYNDAFDLHCGDIVFVEGKLEGLRGRVVEVSYDFKIKLSDYKRVISKADTEVSGELYLAGSHLAAFDRGVIPYEKIISWFKIPEASDKEYFCGSSDKVILLDEMSGFDISSAAAKAGDEYYMDNRVVYICLDGKNGRALVEGSKPYELEFTFSDGEIRNLTCDCYCVGNCKHEFAAMLQLRETLEIIEENYRSEYERSGYFAAVSKGRLLQTALDGKKSGKITLG